jgi:hypothetical protein
MRRRRGQADALAKRCAGEPGIASEFVKDSPVGLIDHGEFPDLALNCRMKL